VTFPHLSCRIPRDPVAGILELGGYDMEFLYRWRWMWADVFGLFVHDLFIWNKKYIDFYMYKKKETKLSD
jgi:hypothetical protein